jgi:acyl-[acyl-carrier-protein]-phospholipid O-acyltransferase / long-chain-fatty-acid--[acyl-carrier-protein] ligase
MSGLLRLLVSRPIWSLTIAQAGTAVNDNLVKNAMIVLALFHLQAGATGLSAVAGALFIAPYILLSAPGGALADRFPKPRLILIYKLTEVALMVVAAVAFQIASVPLLLALLFCLGVQAALFGPAKYGVLPEYLAGSDLLGGNAITEAATFVAIVCGTIAGGGLVQLKAGPTTVGAVGLCVALIGLGGAYRMPALPAADPTLPIRRNILAETWHVVRLSLRQAIVWRATLAISWFWTIGATLLTELPIVVRDIMHASGSLLTELLAVFAIGVGLGSVACTQLLHGRISARLTPVAGIGISLFLWDFANAAQHPPGWRLMLDLLAVAACGGAYSVPLYAIIQQEAPKDARSRLIAANNIMNALFMVLGAAATASMAASGLTAPAILQWAAVANLAAAAVVWVTLRDL